MKNLTLLEVLIYILFIISLIINIGISQRVSNAVIYTIGEWLFYIVYTFPYTRHYYVKNKEFKIATDAIALITTLLIVIIPSLVGFFLVNR